MKKKTITILILATFAASLPVTAQAPFGSRAKGSNPSQDCSFNETRSAAGMPGNRILRHRETLNLTDTQVEQIQQLANQYRAAFESHRTASQASRDSLRQLRRDANYDEAALKRAFEAAQPFRVDGMLLHARFRSELSAILTDDQRTTLEGLQGPRGNRRDSNTGNRIRVGKRQTEGRCLQSPSA